MVGLASVSIFPHFTKIVTFRSLAIGRFSPPDPALLVPACPWGVLAENLEFRSRFFFSVPRGDRLVAQRTPQGGDFFQRLELQIFRSNTPTLPQKRTGYIWGCLPADRGFGFALGRC